LAIHKSIKIAMLILGILGIFIILAIVLYYSPKIDWYSIKLGEKEK